MTQMRLGPQDGLYFVRHGLLHCDPAVRMEVMPRTGDWQRSYAGLPVVMMTAQGPGTIAFSAAHAGETIAVPLDAGRSVDVCGQNFLVASSNVDYRYFRTHVWYEAVNGAADHADLETRWPAGLVMDRFTAGTTPGLLILHAAGNVMMRDLAKDDEILLQSSALVWKDPAVSMSLHFEYPAGEIQLGSHGRGGPYTQQDAKAWLKLHGPGRIAISSVFDRPHLIRSIANHSPASERHWA